MYTLNVMDDSSLLQSLPDDVDELKRLLVAKHHAMANQQGVITNQQDEILNQKNTITKLTHQRDEFYIEKLRLEVRLAKALKQAYGPRADRVGDLGQLLLDFGRGFDNAATEIDDDSSDDQKVVQRRSHKMRTRGRRDIGQLDHLPLIEKEYELPEALCRCPGCQADRKRIGTEVTYTIEFIPGTFVRIKHIQHKYACSRCEKSGRNPNIALAKKTKGSPIDKGMPGPSLLAYIVTSKFGDYLPLHRLENIFARQGFELDRSTMCVWMAAVARLVRPLYDRMVARVLESHVLATDDTVMPMQHPGKTKKARMWIYRGDESRPYNMFSFTLGRSRDGPSAFLKDFTNTLLADAYGGYDGIVLEKELPRAGCWAHARRKFIDCQKAAPRETHAILRVIKSLFALEKRIRDLDADRRLAARQTESAALIESLRVMILEQKEKLLPKHPLAEAIGYVLNQWDELTLFLKDPAVPLDNNLAEQQMKRIALLRKNALFVATPEGGETAAILSSLTSTCRRHDINPQHYLTQLLANLPDTPIGEVDQWLPDAWQQRTAGRPSPFNF